MAKVSKETTFAQFDKAESKAGAQKRRGPAQSMRFETAEGGGYISHVDHKDLAPQQPGGYESLHRGPAIHADLAALHGHIDKIFGDGKKPSKHSKGGTTGDQAADTEDE